MKVKVLEPFGYCFGVKNALKKVNQIIEKHHNKNIILVGPLVHNRNTNEVLKKQGLTIIDNLDQDFLILYFKNLDTIDNIVVFSCHGNYKKVKEFVLDKGFTFYDLVCPIVDNNIKKISVFDFDKLIFIGNKEHIESKYLFSYTDKDIIDISRFKNDKNYKYLVLNQTTYPSTIYNEDIKNINKLDNVTVYKNICLEPFKRYEILKKKLKNNSYDFVFVVGDTTSANTKNLLKIYQNITKSNNIEIVNDYRDIVSFDFKSDMSILVLSGTSASNEDVLGVINYLKSKE